MYQAILNPDSRTANELVLWPDHRGAIRRCAILSFGKKYEFRSSLQTHKAAIMRVVQYIPFIISDM